MISKVLKLCFRNLVGRYTWGIILIIFTIVYIALNMIPYRNNLPKPTGQFNPVELDTSYKISKTVYQMWKDKSEPIPSDLTRWQQGCILVNPDYNFKFFYDSDLFDFVSKNYPQYAPLFYSLYGVYMADMARVLLVYHYGGIYMDLDFYCHKPFSCLERILAQELKKVKSKHLCVVSREPELHAQLFRQKDRVIIQDFYMCTEKHPFLKWFLDDRMQSFERGEAGKGPFSYSIEKDIDRYRSSIIKELSSNSSLSNLIDEDFFLNAGDIYELQEGVLHSLVDSSNSKLWKSCANSKEGSDYLKSICDSVHKNQFFSPIPETIAVHMWSHVYLVLCAFYYFILL